MTKSELITRLKNSLPGIRAHEEFAPYRKQFENQAESIRKKAAVGVHIYPHKQVWHFLLIERSTYNGKHSAQMAFPGGKPESSDLHLEYTARRESEEELAIPVTSGEKITELSMVWIPVSSFEVSPFVFIHDQRPPISKNEREVAQCHEINLNDLLSKDSVSKQTIQVSEQVQMKDIPCFILNEKIVWGATALILAELKMLLLSD
jgi:8-oxo-dGTP pyrophosphatase MutT (NUDIX family)